MINLPQPLRLKHIMAPAPQRHHARKPIRMRMRQPNRIVPPGRKRPHNQLLAVDALLRIDPVEQARVLPVRALRVVRQRGGVAGPGDLEDDGADALLAPAFHPHGQLGAVAVQARHDDDDGRGGGGGRGLGQQVVDGDVGALALDGVDVRDQDLLDRVLAQSAGGAVSSG